MIKISQLLGRFPSVQKAAESFEKLTGVIFYRKSELAQDKTHQSSAGNALSTVLSKLDVMPQTSVLPAEKQSGDDKGIHQVDQITPEKRVYSQEAPQTPDVLQGNQNTLKEASEENKEILPYVKASETRNSGADQIDLFCTDEDKMKINLIQIETKRNNEVQEKILEVEIAQPLTESHEAVDITTEASHGSENLIDAIDPVAQVLPEIKSKRSASPEKQEAIDLIKSYMSEFGITVDQIIHFKRNIKERKNYSNKDTIRDILVTMKDSKVSIEDLQEY